ncbi:hypothetical protein [Alicyclobacillus sp. ALC3]|uniref:hypothetical protein n=1 Tax=Alicyclobacillus sp. ALC3 TaxID=2796143 RepID=UPI0023797E58|nr:hypothetical protein [Alicyclobacillus sp. ALC3]WDL98508.1 hypothetical protein JC200_07460 [Alicyclobacillus sp. ALC3]
MSGFWSELGDLWKSVSESAAEITEVLTGGFGEIVIRGNLDYKTSYEKRAAAKQIISLAKMHYDVSLAAFETVAMGTQILLEIHYMRIGMALNGPVKDWLRIVRETQHVPWAELMEKHPGFLDYLTFVNEVAIESLVQSAPVPDNPPSYDEKLNAPNFFTPNIIGTGIAAGSLTVPVLGGPAILVTLPVYVTIVAFDQHRRVKEADALLAGAEKYRLEVENSVKTMDLLAENFLATKHRLDEAQKLIDLFQSCLVSLNERVQQVPIRQKHWFRRLFFKRLRKDELNLIKTSYNLVVAIHNLCISPVLTKEGFVSSSLKYLLDKLEKDADTLISVFPSRSMRS